ncbi:acyltransferase [Mucilaginibacter sp. FT3.2]|uniref:acyltransferase n=1 Tax=Mucilaginibacter sp. FT3.2 TaxID=2723090 RepID=UPI0016176B1A|nr:acyltransferase [Mucilaginibacter sp. FT3.2]MBB6232524.1 acetyltransferase-like isoleucine patch superfamily enzyme [Mucilaginibacter sp. FT3.2]
MTYYIRKFYRVLRFLYYKVAQVYSWLISSIKFYLNGVQYHRDFIGFGIPILDVNMQGSFTIGKRFRFNSGKYHAMGGRQQQCYFVVAAGAKLSIGENVGVTSVAFICHNKISIGNNVKIGINTVIYDTDFHSLDARYRNNYPELLDGVKSRPVVIKDGAFIGGHSTILKGVTIGKNSIVGAGSVVFQDIPDEQVWIGNPAQFVKENQYATVLT